MTLKEMKARRAIREALQLAMQLIPIDKVTEIALLELELSIAEVQGIKNACEHNRKVSEMQKAQANGHDEKPMRAVFL